MYIPASIHADTPGSKFSRRLQEAVLLRLSFVLPRIHVTVLPGCMHQSSKYKSKEGHTNVAGPNVLVARRQVSVAPAHQDRADDVDQRTEICKHACELAGAKASTDGVLRR